MLGALADNSRATRSVGEPARLGETFIVLTGDHGMENQNPAGKDFANGVFFGELRDADVEFIWQDRNVYLLTMHAELRRLARRLHPAGHADADVPHHRRRRRRDRRAPADRGRERAAPTSGSEVLTGTTAADGTVTFTFAQPVAAVALGADKDADPALGTRTTGSTSPEPITHGQVTKADFNDLARDLHDAAGRRLRPGAARRAAV